MRLRNDRKVELLTGRDDFEQAQSDRKEDKARTNWNGTTRFQSMLQTNLF